MLENIGLLMLGVAIGLAVYRFVVNKTPVTLESITTAVEEVEPLADRLEKTVQVVVNSIEQERREPGSYAKTPDEMTHEVLNFVKEFVPQARSVSNESITKFIKSAVLIASNMAHQIESSKATVRESAVVVAESKEGDTGNLSADTFLGR